jgi:hypothetical protein
MHAHVGVDEKKPTHEREIRIMNPKNTELHVHMNITIAHNVNIWQLEEES